MKKIKVLCVLPTINICGGIEKFYMSYFENFSSNVCVDFITHESTSDEYKKIIEDKQGKLYIMPKINLKNLKHFKNELKKFFELHNDYDIIHCNMANAACFYFYEAKKYNINIRILHSHQNNYADKFTHKIRNIPLVFLGKKMASHNMACTKVAGDFLFKNEEYIIINNAIDIDKFKYDENIRMQLRKEKKIENAFVVGNVGRLTEQKNQKFLLDIFKNIVNEREDSILLLIGDGELKDELVQYSKKLDIYEKVRFIEPVSDINKFYQIMDVFVLPSLYEGLGIVNIEAENSGLKVFVSENVPKDIDITDLVTFISLNKSAKFWAEKILNCNVDNRRDYSNEITENNYNIYKESKKLEEYYKKLIREN